MTKISVRAIRKAYLDADRDYHQATILLWNELYKREDFSTLVQDLAFQRLTELVHNQAATLNALNSKFASRGMVEVDEVPDAVKDTRTLQATVARQLQKGEISMPTVDPDKLAEARGKAFRALTIWNSKKKGDSSDKRMTVDNATGIDLISAGEHLGSVASGMGRRSFALLQVARSMNDPKHKVRREFPNTKKGNRKLGALVPDEMEQYDQV